MAEFKFDEDIMKDMLLEENMDFLNQNGYNASTTDIEYGDYDFELLVPYQDSLNYLKKVLYTSGLSRKLVDQLFDYGSFYTHPYTRIIRMADFLKENSSYQDLKNVYQAINRDNMPVRAYLFENLENGRVSTIWTDKGNTAIFHGDKVEEEKELKKLLTIDNL